MFLRISSFLIAVLLTLSLSFAQTSSGNMNDLVYLKNGSILRGNLLESDGSGKLKVQIYGGSIFAFSPEEIEKIEKTDAPVPATLLPPAPAPITAYTPAQRIVRPIVYPKDGSIYTILDGSLSPSGRIIVGKRINHLVQVGGGAGIHLNLLVENSVAKMPLFLDFRGDLLENKPVTPFYYASLGYTQPLFRNQRVDGLPGKYANGREYVDVGIGIKRFTRQNVAFTASIGYRRLTTERDVVLRSWISDDIELARQRNTIARLAFSVGMVF